MGDGLLEVFMFRKRSHGDIHTNDVYTTVAYKSVSGNHSYSNDDDDVDDGSQDDFISQNVSEFVYISTLERRPAIIINDDFAATPSSQSSSIIFKSCNIIFINDKYDGF